MEQRTNYYLHKIQCDSIHFITGVSRVRLY